MWNPRIEFDSSVSTIQYSTASTTSKCKPPLFFLWNNHRHLHYINLFWPFKLLIELSKQTISYKTTYDIRAKGSVHRKCSRISNFHLRLSLLYIYFLYCHITSKLKHVVIGGFPTFIWKTKVLTRISYFYLCQDTVEQEQLLRVFHTYLKANAGHI